MIDLSNPNLKSVKKETEASPRTVKRPLRKGSPLEKRNYEKRILAQHSSESREHYGPKDVLESCSWLMGGIELDPCSNWLANTVIKAKRFIGLSDDGLAVAWEANTLYCNPPGGDTAKVRPELREICRSYPCIWWGKLVNEWMLGNVKTACFMIFQLNLLQSVQSSALTDYTFLDFPMVVFKDRLRFLYPLDTEQGIPKEGTTLQEGTAPPGGSALCWLPPFDLYTSDKDVRWNRFEQAFKAYGKVLNLTAKG